MSDVCKIVTEYAVSEITEKKSRFIAEVFPVKSMEDAKARLAETEKKYWDARHHCYAFVLGMRSEISRCSDNGEPSGTAGKPILEVLNGAGLTDTLIVVTRYFGGVLLGTGGLVRAYTKAAQAALAAAKTARIVRARRLTLRFDYSRIDAVRRCLQANDISVDAQRYTEAVEFDLTVPSDRADALSEALVQATGGAILCTEVEEGSFPVA